jgi:hypothetical protein
MKRSTIEVNEFSQNYTKSQGIGPSHGGWVLSKEVFGHKKLKWEIFP